MKDERLHNALVDSLRLSTLGHHQEALRLMDEVLTEAMKEGDDLTLFTLIDHAALLSHGRDRFVVKHYYEQCLACSPENPRALYGLADVAMEDGQTDLARQYAKRCHRAILKSDDAKIKQDLRDLVLERWPEIAD